MQDFFNKKILFYTAAFLFAIATIEIANFIHRAPVRSQPVQEKWNVSFDQKNLGEYSVPFYLTGQNRNDFSKGIYTLYTEFNLSQSNQNPLLVFPNMCANAFSVYIDSKLVGRIGDIQNGRTNRWNTPHSFFMPEDLAEGTHTLTIRAYGLYEIGLSFTPYFVNGNSLPFRLLLLNFLKTTGIEFLTGALLVLALIFILIARIIISENKHRLLLAISLFGLSLYLFDYLFIPYLPFEYYTFKKIPLIGLYIAFFFSIPGFFGYHNRQLTLVSKLVMLFPLISFIVMIVYPDNMFEVRDVYKYANLSLFPFILLMHASFFHRRTTDARSRLIIFGLTFMTIIALRDVIIIIADDEAIILSFIGVAVFFLMLTIAFIMEMAEYYTELIKMEKWADTVYQESMHDPLTGALNRKALTVLKKLRPENLSIIILDLDDFKQINDTYGHQAGDRVLIAVSEAISQNIRKSDYVVRLGGDEFAVILFGCDLETAHSSAENLLKRIQHLKIQYNSFTLRINCSMGVGVVPMASNVDERMVQIDHSMYQAKRTGKGRVVVHS